MCYNNVIIIINKYKYVTTKVVNYGFLTLWPITKCSIPVRTNFITLSGQNYVSSLNIVQQRH